MLSIQLSGFPVLVTERLVLRELLPLDAEQVFLFRSDPEVMRHVARTPAKSVEDARALIDLITANVAAKDAVQWAITLKNEEALIGIIGFWRIQKEHYLAELGYSLQRTQWGKGLMSEAIAAVLHFGFGTLGLHKVEAVTRPANAGSIRALEKNGFEREGHLKENIFWEGVFHDSFLYGRLAR